MRTTKDALSAPGGKLSPIAAERPVHRTSRLGRLLAALVMGLILLVLSALIRSAAAAALGGGWTPLGAIWLAAIVITLLAVYGARTSLAAWRRMCLINGAASLGLLGIGTADLVSPGISPDIVQPFGPVLGVALVSGALAAVGVFLAVLFFAAWYLLSRPGTGSDQHA